MPADERIRATYWLETGDDPARAAEVIAGEQSSGTFVALPGETPELKARAGARIESLEPIESVDQPSLPGGMTGGRYHRCRLTLSWPLANLGASIPNLMATVAGNLFELRQVTGLRVLDLDLPAAFALAYPGPAFGIAGTRRLAGVAQGPLIGTIIKPSVGLSPEQTAEMVRELIDAGIDFIKDDELQADGPACPFEARVRSVMREVHAGADRTGRRPMVAFNLTGDLDEMRRRHDFVLAQGGNCVMVSLNSVGLVGVHALRRHAQLPIHGHRNGWGYLNRSPALGWSFVAWQKLWRLVGVDHLHVNGLRNKFSESDASVIDSARSVLAPMYPDKPLAAMPVFSSGQTGLQARDTFAALGTTDLIHAAGGGILGHPMGTRGGVVAMREAWVAAVADEPLDQAALRSAELASALRSWRSPA